jgi:hypothetical protein
MGNCAAIQVGAYVDTCVGKPCSPACPTNACESPGDVCVNGMCIGSVISSADCSLESNKCTMSCIDKSSCQQCPSKPGCTYTGNLCTPECYTGEWCDAGTCKTITPEPVVTGCSPPCGTGYVCYNGVCNKTLPEYDVYGCNKDIGETWCAAQGRCHIEYEDPCNPIVPGGNGTYHPPDESTPIAFDSILQNPQMLAILGIALIGGFIMMSSGKGK